MQLTKDAMTASQEFLVADPRRAAREANQEADGAALGIRGTLTELASVESGSVRKVNFKRILPRQRTLAKQHVANRKMGRQRNSFGADAAHTTGGDDEVLRDMRSNVLAEQPTR